MGGQSMPELCERYRYGEISGLSGLLEAHRAGSRPCRWTAAVPDNRPFLDEHLDSAV